ncbi:MAG TPA: OsmC family protein [Gaiellaceae bacterium]|nr:OsmC family protein [Gaiellaceae bacterium]
MQQDFAIGLAPDGSLHTEDGTALEAPPAWTPEHLLLAGLVRCSIESLRFHAKRAGIELAVAEGSAKAHVAKRESDGRYAVVESSVALAVRLVPPPDDSSELLAKAERDCFVGASLTAKPQYRWTVS